MILHDSADSTMEHARPGSRRARLHRGHALAKPRRVPLGREEVRRFLQRKWAKELDYRLIKELWAFTGNRIAVRFAYEWHDDSGHWYRSYGNENWEFNDQGFMMRTCFRGAQVPLAAGTAARRSSGVERPGAVTGISDRA